MADKNITVMVFDKETYNKFLEYKDGKISLDDLNEWVNKNKIKKGEHAFSDAMSTATKATH